MMMIMKKEEEEKKKAKLARNFSYSVSTEYSAMGLLSILFSMQLI